MFRTHFKTAWRYLFKNYSYSLLNIVGLSIALAVFLLIFLFTRRELSYDRFHKNSGSKYLVTTSYYAGDELINANHFPAPFIQKIRDQVPEISITTLLNFNYLNEDNLVMLKYKNEEFKVSNMGYCDQYFADIFSFKVIEGNINDALMDPNSIIITESLAFKIFGTINIINEAIEVNHKNLFLVKAVLEDPPENSSIQYNGFFNVNASMKISGRDINATPYEYGNLLFIELNGNSDTEKLVRNKIKQFIIDYEKPQMNPDDLEMLNKFSVNLTSLNKFYFNNSFDESSIRHGNKLFVFLILIIGVVILIVAFINFINLTQANNVGRIHYVMIKKVNGALKKNIISQFFMETIILCFISLFFAYIFAELLFGQFNNLIEYSLNPGTLYTPIIIVFLVIFITVVSFILCLFPVFYILKQSPADLLKGDISKGRERISLQKVFVVFQFIVSIILIISILQINKQLRFINNKDLGFDKNNCLELPLYLSEEKKQSFVNEIKELPSVINIGLSTTGIGSNNNWGGEIEENGVSKEINYLIIKADENYIKTMGFKILQGRNFNKEMPTDIGSWIINETAVNEFGLTRPLSAKLSGYPVIGVIKDFNIQKLNNRIQPVAIMYYPKHAGNATIRISDINSSEIKQTLKQIKKIWESFIPDKPFTFNFLNERINGFYIREEKLLKIIIYTSIISVIIGCLGLFGLALFAANRRTKEIGIRKTNGAKTLEIVLMLSGNFSKLVILAFIISSIVSWYILNKWLQNFAYRTNLSWWIFAAAGVLAFTVALLTVSWQSYRAASRNPVEALRYE